MIGRTNEWFDKAGKWLSAKAPFIDKLIDWVKGDAPTSKIQPIALNFPPGMRGGGAGGEFDRLTDPLSWEDEYGKGERIGPTGSKYDRLSDEQKEKLDTLNQQNRDFNFRRSLDQMRGRRSIYDEEHPQDVLKSKPEFEIKAAWGTNLGDPEEVPEGEEDTILEPTLFKGTDVEKHLKKGVEKAKEESKEATHETIRRAQDTPLPVSEINIHVGDSTELLNAFERIWHKIYGRLNRLEAQEMYRSYQLRNIGTYL